MSMSFSEMLEEDYSLLSRSYIKQKIENDYFELLQAIKSDLYYRSGDENETVSLSVASDVVSGDCFRGKPALLVNTDFGQIFMFNFDNFYHRLTGIKVVDEGCFSMANVNMANALLPRFIYDAFGWATPVKPVKIPSKNCVVLFVKITDNEFTLPLMIAADNKVWLKMLYRRWRKNDIIADEQLSIPMLVNVSCGSIEMTRERWKTLEAGDVIVLSSPTFDTDGKGVVTIGCRSRMLVKWLYGESSPNLKFNGWVENMALDELEQPLDDRNTAFENDSMDENFTSPSGEDDGMYENLVSPSDGGDGMGENLVSPSDEGEGTDENLVLPSDEGEGMDENFASPSGEDEGLVPFSDTPEVLTLDNVFTDPMVSGFPVDEIPLAFCVQLGTFSLSIREACQLSEGSLIKLHTDTPGQVKIFCQDREVARGELVDIEGRLGVKIIRNWGIKN